MLAMRIAWLACAGAFTAAALVPGFPRRCATARRAAADGGAPARELLPLMPFGSDEVLIPGQSRYLHLYEARFLALFDHATKECGDDVVLGFFAGDNALLRCATRARVDRWERLDVGVGVTLRGVSRCSIAGVDQTEDHPFLLCALEDLADAPGGGGGEAAAAEIRALADEVDALAARHDIDAGRSKEIAVDPRAMVDEADVGDVARSGSLGDRVAALSADARAGDATDAELLSFLALEGAPPDLKLRMLASTSRAERLDAAKAELERQKAELAAKASLKSALSGLSWGDEDP